MSMVDINLVSSETINSGHNFIISILNGKPLSYFSDNIWNFSPHIENNNCKKSDKEINFSIIILGDKKLTNISYEKLLQSIKGFLYARLTRPHPRSGKISKARTVVGIWFRLRPLIKWMVNRDIYEFSALSEYSINEYRNHVLNLGLAANTIGKRLSILEMLYLFSDYYPTPLKQHPWPSETSVAISGETKNDAIRMSKQTLSMPPEVFTKLGLTALDFVENQSENIISAYNECCDVLRAHRSTAIRSLDTKKHKSVVQEREFQIQYCSARARMCVLLKIVNNSGFNDYGELNSGIRKLQTAAYIICGMFSGIRDSEIASLEVGAFYKEINMDGDTYYWLNGRSYKLEKTTKNTRWMVPECVGKAITVLEKITIFNRESLHYQLEYLRSKKSTKSIQTEIQKLNQWSKCLFLTKANRGYTYKNIDNETANNRLRKFVKENNITNENGKLWPITTHQFRRTFAVFVAKNLMGDLRYLRHHFKHWSMDMTLYYARLESGDETLISEVITERDRLNRIIVSDWLSDDTPLSGKRGKAIVKFRTRNKVKTAVNISDATGQLADGLFIRSTGHSWCLSNTDSCGGQGLYDSLQCVSCDNAVIDKPLLSAWKGIKEHQKQILRLEDIGEPIKYHARQQIKAADKIIKELSGE